MVLNSNSAILVTLMAFDKCRARIVLAVSLNLLTLSIVDMEVDSSIFHFCYVVVMIYLRSMMTYDCNHDR